MKLISGDKRWYVARIPLRNEEAAAENLRLAGFESYLPRYRKDIPNKRTHTFRTLTLPLMPGYLFVCLREPKGDDPRDRRDEQFAAINSALSKPHKAVDHIVPVRREPKIHVAGKDVASLQEMEWDMQFDDTRAARIHRNEVAATRKETFKMQFPVGSQVTVEGAIDLIGMVVKHEKTGRFKIDVNMFGKSFMVDADPEKLRPAA